MALIALKHYLTFLTLNTVNTKFELSPEATQLNAKAIAKAITNQTMKLTKSTGKITATIMRFSDNHGDGTSQSCNCAAQIARQALELYIEQARELYDGDDNQINCSIFSALDSLKY